MVLLLPEFFREPCKVFYAEGVQFELELEEASLRLVVLQELQHIVEHTAKKHYGRALGAVHTVKEFIQLVHLLCPCGGQ